MLCKKQKKLNIFILLMAVALAVLSWPITSTAQIPEDPNLLEEPHMPGTIEGTGTYFEVTDSNYINITLENSEVVHLRLESAPRMIVMEIEAAEGANSTQITLGGFEPNTTYYKYEDDYHNLIEFTTNESGACTYTQDLTERHLVFIQPEPSTIFLSDSGWSNPAVGDWDPVTKTGTLTTNVTETIQIDSHGITLDGGGFSVIGTGTGFGVYLYQKSNVTIKNLTVEGFTYGIRFYSTSHNTMTGNTASNNLFGIYLYLSSNNILTGNTASNNGHGIFVSRSSNNTLTDNIMSGNQYNFTLGGSQDNHFYHDIDTSNLVDGKLIYLVVGTANEVYDNSTAPDAGTFYAINCDNITIRDLMPASNNYAGIYLFRTHNSTIENVTTSNNNSGIYLIGANYNTLTGNSASDNVFGIYLHSSSNNILTGNAASNNSSYGIILNRSPANNTLTGNIANSNTHGIYLAYSSNNTLTGNTANSNTLRGIYLYDSSNNTLTGNIASNNSSIGIYLHSNSSNNTLTDNIASNNKVGIRLYFASYNQIYNNNFIDNTYRQVLVSGGSGNVFNLDAPTGGNYWSDWTTPDNDGDGFVDSPYVFSSGQDNLPWAIPNGWVNQPPVAVCQDVTVMAGSYCEGIVEPADVDNGSSDPDGDAITLSLSPEGPYPIGTTAVTLTVTDDQGASSSCTATVKVLTASGGTLQLVAKVMVLNLQNGIENSLDAKLDAALQALDDLNANNDAAAINAINAFINAVQAQSGNKIATEDADDLIDIAHKIVVGLLNGCY